MTENSRAIAATIVGSVIGAVAGYLFFTENGRLIRRQIEPALEDIARELSSFRGTVRKVAGVANESWKLVSETVGEGNGSAARFPNPHQSSPF